MNYLSKFFFFFFLVILVIVLILVIAVLFRERVVYAHSVFPFIEKKKLNNTYNYGSIFGSGDRLNKTRQVLDRPVCDRGAIPRKIKNSTQTTLPHFNFSVTTELNDVRSRLIILINEEINEANCMISNSAKLDRRTKQHTQFGVSESHGSRDMVRTKSWRKKKEKKMNAWKTI